MFVGSHDSATREALVATIKGKVPYIYTPVYEGGECAFNTYVIADTPEQQIRPSVAFMMKDRGAKSVYLIGDDYVWPRKCNEQAKKYIADNGGKVGNDCVDQAQASLPTTGSSSRATARARVAPTPVTR